MFRSHSSKAENQILSHFGLNLSVCHASVWFCNDNFFSSHFAFSHFCNVGFILINVQWSFPAFLYEWIEMCLICVFCHSCSQYFESFCLKTTNCRCCLKDCVCRNLGTVLFRWSLWRLADPFVLLEFSVFFSCLPCHRLWLLKIRLWFCWSYDDFLFLFFSHPCWHNSNSLPSP